MNEDNLQLNLTILRIPVKFSAISCAIAALIVAALSSPAVQAQTAPTLTFQEPATEYTNIQLYTGPSMTVFTPSGSTNAYIYLAFEDAGTNNTLWIAQSTTAGAFTNTASNYTNMTMLEETAPAILSWNNELWVFYTDKTTKDLYFATSTNGTTFTTPAPVLVNDVAVSSVSQPSAAVVNSTIWLSWVQAGSGTATNAAYAELEGGYFEPVSICSAGPNGEEPQTGAAIGIAPFTSSSGSATTMVAFQAQGNWNHIMVICSSYGDYSFSSEEAGGGVSGTSFDGYTYFAYKDQSSNNEIYVAGANVNGETINPVIYSGLQMNGRQNIAPASVVYNNKYYLAFTENGTTHHLWVTTAPLP